MPQQVNLTDEELSAAIGAGLFKDPAMLDRLDSDSRRRFVRVQATSEPTVGRIGPEPGWASKYPTVAGVARGALSTLPAAGGMVGGLMGLPEGFVGALPGMALGAGVGRGAQDLLMEGLGLTPPTSPMDKAKGIAADTALGAAGPIAAEGGMAALRAGAPLARRVVSPGMAEDVSALVLGESRTARAKSIGDRLKGRPAATAPASSPTPPVAAEAAAPTPDAPAAAPTSSTAPKGRGARAVARTAAARGQSLTPEEERQALVWLQNGDPPNVILDRILASRKLTGSLGTPTPDEMRARITQRNETGRWPDEP